MTGISVIIANYNTANLLDDCVSNILSIKEELAQSLNIECIVIDNGSKDESVSIMQSKYGAKIKFFPQENLGLSKAYNVGAKNADYEYLLYLGSDCYPKANDLTEISKYMDANNNVGIVSAKLVLRDGSIDKDAHRGFPTPFNALFHFSMLDKFFPKSKTFAGYFLTYLNMDEVHEIDLCISHFMFMRKSALEKIGYWDEDFFVYGEDVDVCFRIKKAGFKIMYFPKAVVLHFKGATIGRSSSKDIKTASRGRETKLSTSLHSTRAMKLFYDKHMSKEYPKALTALVLFGISTFEKLRMLKARLF